MKDLTEVCGTGEGHRIGEGQIISGFKPEFGLKPSLAKDVYLDAIATGCIIQKRDSIPAVKMKLCDLSISSR